MQFSLRIIVPAIFSLLAALFSVSVGQAQNPVSISPNSWALGAPMPTPREASFAGVIGTKIYVIGGGGGANGTLPNVNEIYDTTTNTWSTGAPIPTSRWVGASAVVNNILYAIGGANANTSTPLNVVEAYDPVANTWSTKAPMPIASDSISATVSNGIIYVVGGYTPANGRLSAFFSYNPANNTWSTLPSLKVGKSQPAVVAIGATILAAGGLATSGTTTDTEGYNLASNSWTTLAPMPTSRNTACFESVGSKLYAATGSTSGVSGALTSMDSYDVVTNSWTTGLPVIPHGVSNPTSVSVGGSLYCFGGASNGSPLQGTVYNYVQIYQPSAPPAISNGGVVSASGFGGFTSIAPGSFAEVYGSNLATDSRGWASSDFNGNNAPTSLDGTSATIDGQAAFINYISPSQIDIQVPSNVLPGPRPLIVTTSSGASAAYTLNVNATQPGLLAPPSFIVSGKQYVVAFFSDGTYALPPGAVTGVASRRAKPGDVLVFYGVGFGPVTPTIAAGQIAQQSNSLVNNLQISFGGMAATAQYAGLAPGYVGLYQFNVTVPNVPASDLVPLTFTLGATAGSQTLYIPVQN